MGVTNQQLKLLFQAHREDNGTAFRRAAESIIATELAANHQFDARELKRMLGEEKRTELSSVEKVKLTPIPKDRRHGDDLIVLQDSRVDGNRIVLQTKTRDKVNRILSEHHKRSQLARFGLVPKTKLLFWGPPGCGKTLTASYIAHELGIPIGVVRLNSLISSYLGDTTSHLQRVFDLANSRPVVLLLDEVDALGKNRDDPNDVGELKRVVNGFLQSMDFFSNPKSLVIAASNHQYLLDSALWRRFDDIIHFPMPTDTERSEFLKKSLSGIRHGPLESIERKMKGFSFSDIERIVIEATKTMVLDGRKNLDTGDLLDQIKLHLEDRKAKIIPKA